MSAAVRGNPRSSGYDRQPDQWYREPRRAVDALLNVEPFDGTVWDPCCGAGNIPEACLARGISVLGSDIVDRGWLTFQGDFLETENPGADHIICNPPFDLAVDFVLRGIGQISGKVAVLQRTSWLEGERRYQRLFRLGHLARVWQFRSRLSMPPGDSNVEAKGGSVSFAWFIFSKRHRGPWTGGWLP